MAHRPFCFLLYFYKASLTFHGKIKYVMMIVILSCLINNMQKSLKKNVNRVHHFQKYTNSIWLFWWAIFQSIFQHVTVTSKYRRSCSNIYIIFPICYSLFSLLPLCYHSLALSSLGCCHLSLLDLGHCFTFGWWQWLLLLGCGLLAVGTGVAGFGFSGCCRG